MKLSNALKLKRNLEISPNMKQRMESKKFHSVQRSKEIAPGAINGDKSSVAQSIAPDYLQE